MEPAMSAFDDDFAEIESMFAEVFGVTVAYVAGGETIIAGLTAQVALNQHQVFDEDDVVRTVRSRDYLVAKADLVDDEAGEPVTPIIGHKFREVIDGETRTFEVMPIADRPCWEPADAAGRQIVIHTKEVGS